MDNRTIICRVGYCPKCGNLTSHRRDITYLVHGNHGYHIYHSQFGSIIQGFTPHLYRIRKVIGSNITFEEVCTINGCGIDIYDTHQGRNTGWRIRQEEWRKGIITTEQWNALVMYRRDKDYHID